MIFTAPVVAGSGRGKDLRVPTLNVPIDSVPSECEKGIYACFVQINDRIYSAAMHYGPRTVFHDSTSCEVHLLDMAIESTPSHVKIEIIRRLRNVQNFDSPEELQQQMMRDMEEARAILMTKVSTL